MHLFKAENLREFTKWFQSIQKACAQTYTNSNTTNSSLLLNQSTASSLSGLSETSSHQNGSSKLLHEHVEHLNSFFNTFNIYDFYKNNSKINGQECRGGLEMMERPSSSPPPPLREAKSTLLLVSCLKFSLNLNIPIISSPINGQSSSSSSFSTSQTNTNSELFFVHFSLYDAKYSQKITETFTWIPNWGQYFSPSQFLNMSQHSSNMDTITLDGKTRTVKAEHLNSNLLANVTKALFTIKGDLHSEIFLVARIEKLLDGSSLHASVQPYLLQQNEAQTSAAKLKASIKLHKKVSTTPQNKTSQLPSAVCVRLQTNTAHRTSEQISLLPTRLRPLVRPKPLQIPQRL
jgi:hypothetical protein